MNPNSLDSVLGPINHNSARLNTLIGMKGGIFGPLAGALISRWTPNGGGGNFMPAVQNSTSLAPMAAIATPNTGGLDPINKFQQDLQNNIGQTQAPFDYSFYRTAASQNPTYNQFLASNAVTNPYTFSNSMWSQYGGSGDQSSASDGIQAYMNMTKDNYTWLKQNLGREPTQAETYAASNLGRQQAYDAISSGNTEALAPYNQLFV